MMIQNTMSELTATLKLVVDWAAQCHVRVSIVLHQHYNYHAGTAWLYTQAPQLCNNDSRS